MTPPGPQPAPLVIGCHRESSGPTRVELGGELDLSTADQLTAMLAPLLADRPPAVVVDLAAVTFIDSTGIGTLLAARRQCREAGLGFSILASAEVERITRLLGVHDALTGVSGLPDAPSS